MEWDFKMPPWDLTEFERDAAPEISSIGQVILGSNGGAPVAQATGCSVDLKLGGLGDFGPQAKWNGQQGKVPAAGPSKRARMLSGGIQNASCSVDGCRADLSKCREYHRRHKVCEVHSKTPLVLVAGQEQRFCQQCSRFHMLTEFDEIKRSCRRRLEGHNRRRRKPQPDSVHCGNSFSGGRYSSYSQTFPTTRPQTNWPRIVNQENPLYARQTTPRVDGRDQYLPIPNYSKERRGFPFLQGNQINLHGTTTFGTPTNQLQLRSMAKMTGSTSCSNSTSKMFNNETAQVFNSDCALSLLSSPSQISHIVPSADQIPVGHAAAPSLKYGDYEQYCYSQKAKTVSATGFSCLGVKYEPVGTVLVPDANDIELHCQSIFHFGGEGTSDGRNPDTQRFSWQ